MQTLTHIKSSIFSRKTCIVNVLYEDISVLLNICVCAESGLFGVPLATLLDQDQRRAPGTKVPFILQRVSTAASYTVRLTQGQFNITAMMRGSLIIAAIYKCMLLYFPYGS